MRNLFILLICTLAVTGFSANPAYTDFRGTNEVLVTTNPATGRIIIGPATPISTQINAAQVWTNDVSIPAVVLNNPTNAILLGQGPSFISSGGFLEVVSPDREGAGGVPTVYMTHTLTASSGSAPVILSVNLAGDDSGVKFGDSGAIKINSSITGRKNGWFYGNGAAGLYSQAGSNTGSTNNSANAIVGYAYGREGQQAGVVGISDSKVSGYQVCPGVIGGSFGEGNVGTFMGGLFFVDAAGDFNEPTNLVSSCLTLENFSGHAALLIGRTNNGTFEAFKFLGTKSTNATPFDAGALFSAYNGVATLLHNTSTNTLITVGSSPFNFTNTASQTIVLYLDANGATTTVDLNGQTIFKSLVAGDHTIILKPSAYTTITYSIATPIMTWTEL